MKNKEASHNKKYLTIVFVDITNSTQLFENMDPEDVSDLLQDFLKNSKSIIENNHGIINQTAGDGFYAVFGLDQNHFSDQSFWACHAACQLKDRITDVELKIGIDCGYLVHTENSEFSDLKHHLVGNVVNQASHLCEYSEKSKPLVSENVYLEIKNYFHCYRTSQETNHYIISGLIDHTNKFQQTPENRDFFVGRQHEINSIRDAILSSFKTNGQKIHITGESGIGKTSLIFQILENIDYQPLKILSHCWLPDELNKKDMLETFLNQCLQLFQLHFTNISSIESFLTKAGIYKNSYALILAQHMKVSIPSGIANYIAPDQIDFIKANLITQLLEHFSKQHQILVIFDDLQWADRSCKILLKALYSKSNAGNYALLTSSHNNAEKHDLISDHNFFLSALTENDISKLIENQLGTTTYDEDLAEDIYNLSEGNTYLIKQICTYLKDNHKNLKDNHKKRDKLSKSLIPKTINHVFLSKFSLLNTEEKEFLNAASIIGQSFTLNNLTDLLANQCSKQIHNTFLSLKKKGFLKQISIFNDILEFSHALERQFIYEGLSKKDKTQKHLTFLQRLEKQNTEPSKRPYRILARHAHRASEYKKAYLYGAFAGRKEIEHSLPKTAVEYFELSLQALEKFNVNNPRDDFRLFKSYLRLTKAYCLHGDGKKAQNYLRKSQNLLSNLDSPIKIQASKILFDVSIAVNWLLFDYNIETLESYEHDIANGCSNNRIEASIRVAGMFADIGQFKESNDRFLKILGDLKLNDHSGLLFPTYSATLADISRNYGEIGQYFLASEYSKDALGQSQDRSFSAKNIYILTFSASHLIRQKKFQQALDLLEEAYILTTHFKVGFVKPFVIGQYAYCKYLISGDFHKNEELLSQLIKSMKSKNFGLRLPLYYYFLSDMYHREGQLTQAIHTAQEGLKIAEDQNSKHLIAYLYLKLSALLNATSAEQSSKFLKRAKLIAQSIALKPLLDISDTLDTSNIHTVH